MSTRVYPRFLFEAICLSIDVEQINWHISMNERPSILSYKGQLSYMYGVGGSTVPKLRKFDLGVISKIYSSIVILEIGTNDLANTPPAISIALFSTHIGCCAMLHPTCIYFFILSTNSIASFLNSSLN